MGFFANALERVFKAAEPPLVRGIFCGLLAYAVVVGFARDENWACETETAVETWSLVWVEGVAGAGPAVLD